MVSGANRLPRTRPSLRFRLRSNRRLVTASVAFVMYGRSKYYHCPHCDGKTLVDWRKLTVVPSTKTWPYESPPSNFEPVDRDRFGAIPERSLSFDFYCRGCGSPVRLLYWIEERYGMGGPWYPEIKWVIELGSPSRD